MSLSAGSRLGPGDVDAPYVVQELPEDETLRSVLAGSRLSPSTIVPRACGSLG